MTFWPQMELILVGSAFSLLLNWLLAMYMFRWKKREEVPSELHKEVEDLREQVVNLRSAVKYIEGRLNGRHWKSEA